MTFDENVKELPLNKKWFSFDLFWSTKDGHILTVENIVVVYMDRSSQINTDKLCELFGEDKIINIINNCNMHPSNLKEAMIQIEYYKSRKYNLPFEVSAEDITKINKNPTQRAVDYYMNNNCDKLYSIMETMSLGDRLTVIKMIKYYSENK